MKFYLNNVFWITITAILNPLTLNEFIGIPHNKYYFENAVYTAFILIWLLFFQYILFHLIKKIKWRTFYEKKYTKYYKMIGIFSLLGIIYVDTRQGEELEGMAYLYGVICAIIYFVHYLFFYKRLFEKKSNKSS